MLQFVGMFPQESFSELAKRLGDDVAPIQVEEFLIREGRDTEKDREIAMECLVRMMHEHNRRGWNRGKHAWFRQSSVLSNWLSMSILDSSESPPFEDEKRAVWAALEQGKPPEGWLPLSVSDPIILAAFDKGWMRKV
jgi:hypothetical protein